MPRFPQLSPNDDEHRRLVVSLVWRYGTGALRVAHCAIKDTRDRIFTSPAEAVVTYNRHFDEIKQATKEEVYVD